MGLFDAFASSAAARQTAEIAQQVSRRSCAAVWQRVQAKAISMSPAQARGYIRSHAAPVVEEEAARCGVSHARQRELVPLAREGVVETLLCEITRVQRIQYGRRAA